MDLHGKRAFITGGTKGIGAAIAIDLAQQGCDVAINGRFDDEAAAEVREAIAAAGRKCVTIVADVARPEEAESSVRDAAAALGGLDILVHSAGGPALGNIEQCSPELWHSAFDVHVHAAYYLSRAALPFAAPSGRRRDSARFFGRRDPGHSRPYRVRDGEGGDSAIHALPCSRCGGRQHSRQLHLPRHYSHAVP